MYIYVCRLVTLENLFYASKEVGKNYIMMPYIGNYALTFALGMAEQQYVGLDNPSYKEQIIRKDIYVYPAKFITCNWSMSSFNSTGEGYYLKMDRNVVIDDYRIRNSTKVPIHNSPQIGQFKLIGPESVAVFFIKSEDKLVLPRFIRLGKFMSKCELSYEIVDYKIKNGSFFQRYPLNPIDLSPDYTIQAFEVVSMKPVPLIENIKATGEYAEFELKTDESNQAEKICIATKTFYFLR